MLTPNKKRPRAVGKRSRLMKYDDFTLSCIRRKFHAFFRRNEIPTLDKLLRQLNDNAEIFPQNISRTTLYRLLKDMGFSYERRRRQAALIERSDIILWRRQYLRSIKKHREDKRNIYYLDETWVNEGHTENYVWKDTSIESAQHASSSGLTTGLSAPRGKGRRLIVAHIPNVTGIFVGKKTGDYHEEMDGEHFEKWIEKVMPQLKTKSVIVLDNAPYHSVKIDKV